MIRKHTDEHPRNGLYQGLFLAAIILLAFVLRVHRLTGQSLWGDELWSLDHISAPDVVSVLSRVRADGTAPPGYYIFLHFWVRAAGESEFALRFLSVIWGTLITPVIFALGRRMGGWRKGVSAALIQALSPFHIYYSQEARAYIQATFFSLLASYLFLRLWKERQTLVVWFGYIIAGFIAAGSHYFAWPVLLAHGLFWVGDYAWTLLVNWQHRGEKSKAVVRCFSAQLIILLLCLPWFVYVHERFLGLSGSSARMTTPLAVIIPRLLYDFNVSVPIITGAQEAAQSLPLLPFGFLLLGALLHPRHRSALLTLLVWSTIILLAVFYISFPPWAGWSRYFIALSPYYYLLLARGVDGYVFFASADWAKQYGRRLGYVTLVLLLAIPLFLQARAIQRYYTDVRYARWDYRGQVAALAQDAREGSALVYNGHLSLSLPFRYYTPRDLAWYVLPTDCNPEREQAHQEISAVAVQHEHIWLVRTLPHSCDKDWLVYGWLNEYAYRTHEFWMENHLFSHYFSPGEMLAYTAPTQLATFGEYFTLETYALNVTQPKAGEALAISLRWHPLAVMEIDYKFFLVLLNENGELVALRDGVPGNWTKPTTIWQVGELVSDRWGMSIEKDVPEGVYTLFTGAYNPANGERLPLQAVSGERIGDMLEIITLEITQP